MAESGGGVIGERAVIFRGSYLDRAPENFKFSALWNLKTASKQYKMMVFVN